MGLRGASGCFAALAVTFLAAAASAGGATGETTWFTVTSQTGAPIGDASHEVISTAVGRTVIDTQDLYLSDEAGGSGHQTGRTETKADKSGRVVSISDVAEAAHIAVSTEVRIVGDTALVVRTSPHDRRSLRVALPPGVQFDLGRSLLVVWNPATTPTLAFDAFSIDALAVEHVTMEVDAGAEGAPPGGLVVVRKLFDRQQLMAMSRLILDDRRRIVGVIQPSFGAGIVLAATDQATALAAHAPYHGLQPDMVKSPYRISDAAARGHIRYRFDYADGLVFALPQTGEQAVRMTGPTEAVVDICDGCGPGLGSDGAMMSEALRPSAWIQSDDPAIVALARPVAAMHVSAARKMELLTEIAATRVGQVNFVGHFSASETLRRGEGDCTGTAVLLAALGRAAGIPALVADGLVYTREPYYGVGNAFMPHSWTLAYVDGRWRSYDAALPSFDATHIAVTVGAGDERRFLAAEQLAGLLTWKDLVEVRSRPGG